MFLFSWPPPLQLALATGNSSVIVDFTYCCSTQSIFNNRVQQSVEISRFINKSKRLMVNIWVYHFYIFWFSFTSVCYLLCCFERHHHVARSFGTSFSTKHTALKDKATDFLFVKTILKVNITVLFTAQMSICCLSKDNILEGKLFILKSDVEICQ